MEKSLSNSRFLPSLLSLLSLFAFAAAPARAGEVPHLLADINTHPPEEDAYPVAAPSGFFTLNGRLLFSTAHYDSEDEGILWSTDGTPAGTVQASSSLCASPCGGISSLGAWRNLAFLFTYPEGDYPKLWRTDGSAAGTSLLHDPDGMPGYFYSFYSSPELGAVYFEGYDDAQGDWLWVTDGAPGGTRPLLGADGYPFQYPASLTAWRGRLYFVAYRDGKAEHQDFGLWSTDGTPGGTRFLAEIQSGTRLVTTPSHLFFSAGSDGRDLWVTDGTPGGTRSLLDLDPPPCSPPPDSECEASDLAGMTAADDAVYFPVRRPGHDTEIWRSDGTKTGTRRLIQLPGGEQISGFHRLGGRWIVTVSRGSSGPADLWTVGNGFTQAALIRCGDAACPDTWLSLAEVPGRWIFAGEDADHGIEPWVTDGTGPGTRLLADTCPGSCSGIQPDSYPERTPVVSPAGAVYFQANPSPNGPPDDLWVTDGTPAGTRRVASHTSGDVGFLGGLAWYGRVSPRGASELWRTDGTAGGTLRSSVLRRFPSGSSPIFLPAAAGGRFLADEGDGVRHLWASDGTPEGTSALRGFELAPPRYLGYTFSARAGGLEYFDVVQNGGFELWRSDGTPQGTRGILTLDRHSIESPYAVWNGRLLFSVTDIHGCSLWTSDGTAAGTRQILPALSGVRCPTVLAPLSPSSLLFVARIETPGDAVPQIFATDGTVAGTRQLTDFHGTRLSLDDQAVRIGGAAFFRINNTNGRPELWRSDGTPEGTRRVGDLYGVSALQAFRGAVYGFAFSPSRWLFGLFRFPPNGPPQLLEEVQSPFDEDQPLSFAAVGDRLLFAGYEEEHGAELWTTDGTPAGTHPVRDLRPGDGSSLPDGLTAAGDRVFFSADDGTHGRELWESNGTPEGTRLVADIAPGGFSALSFSLSALTVANGYLFFVADDGTTGLEPWALRLEP
ncbi:MAG: ELWxxDGT repeat protein [Thermoanaerobaculia bacterium]